MLLPTILQLAICSTLLFSTTLAQQQTAQADPYQIKCLRFPIMVIGNQTINPDSISALSTALSDNSFNPPLPNEGITLKAGASSRVGWAGSGGFQVCVQNWWFFKTVTVPLNDLSRAVEAMRGSCCATVDPPQGPPVGGGRRGRCQDAKAIVKATDGSEVKVVAQDYGDNCCGMWGC